MTDPTNQPASASQPPPEGYVEYEEEEGLGLGDYLAILLEARWLIIGITAVAVLIGAARAYLAEPVYQADALLQIEENGNSFSALEQFSTMFEGEPPVNAEIEILRSRMVLGKAVDSLHLDVIARPRYFRYFGEPVARRYRGPAGSVASPLLGQPEYAWGGEEIKVETFTVPSSMLGEGLILTAGKGGRYQLADMDGKPLLAGEVGKLQILDRAGEDKPLSLFVSVLKSRPGTQFQLMRLPRMAAIDDLKGRFGVKEKGKQSNVLELTLTAPDPSAAKQVLNEIADVYVRQNVEQKSVEAKQTLEFLEQQLPKQKEQLDAAITALNSYRLEKGSIDLTFETQNILSGIVEVQSSIRLLQQKREELRQKFTPSHPTIKALDAQVSRLKARLGKLDKRVEELPDTQQVILGLSRDVKVATELYTALLNSAQELRLAKAGTVGNVRIVDYAVLPDKPIKPNRRRMVVIALVLGLFAGAGLALLRHSLRHGVEDPDLLEKQLGIPVYATIPHSKQQAKLTRGRPNKKEAEQGGKGPSLLVKIAEEDPAVESLRSLRTHLHFALMESRNNIIMITGPSPGVGKTFLTANLGAILASAGKKVLLIDADLRKGYLNRYFGIGRGQGLSDLISGGIDLEQAIHSTLWDNLDIIPTGEIPPNPSELLLHEQFKARLDEISRFYDHIIIDSPPVLAVSDAIIIGALAGATLLVLKWGLHPLREVEQTTKRLKQANANLRGIIFNDIPSTRTRYGYGYGYGYQKYAYQYTYKKT